MSSLVAAGYNSDELRRAVTNIDWPSILENKSSLRKNFSMVVRLGFQSGRRLEKTLRNLLAAKGVRQFGDLPAGSLKVVATDLNHGRGIVLPDDLDSLGHDPARFSVARAVLMSSSVPFVFEPVRLHDRITGEDLLMADGAMAARFPVQLVPSEPTTIGFRLRLPENSPPASSHQGPCFTGDSRHRCRDHCEGRSPSALRITRSRRSNRCRSRLARLRHIPGAGIGVVRHRVPEGTLGSRSPLPRRSDRPGLAAASRKLRSIGTCHQPDHCQHS